LGGRHHRLYLLLYSHSQYFLHPNFFFGLF
jgi:hypothetical protein